jgi:CHAT domain-containing protein
MAKYGVVIAVVLAAYGAARPARGQEQAKASRDSPLLRVEGQLTRDDPVDPVLKLGPHKVYTVKLLADTYYEMDLVSSKFDAYLRLEDANGRQLAADDDSGGELNARLVYRAETADAYRIVVTSSQAGFFGEFRLTVKQTDRAKAEQHRTVQAALTLQNEGLQRYAQVRFPEATGRFSQVVDLLRQAYPQTDYPHGHYNLARSLHNLGSVLESQGEYARAEPHLRESLVIFRQHFRKDEYPRGHSTLAVALTGLGHLLQSQRKYAEAESLYGEALAMYASLHPKAKYPQGNANYATCLNKMGHLQSLKGAHAEAKRFYLDALAMREALYPKQKYPRGHPELAGSLHNVGSVFAEEGEYARAERLLRSALAMWEAFLPKSSYPHGHPNIASCLNNLGAVLRAEGGYARAEPFARAALAMYMELGKHTASVAPEPVALNAAATYPLARDGLLSVTRHLAGSDARSYEAVWHSRAALTRVYERRHLALIAAATDNAVRMAWDELQTLRRQREQMLMSPALGNTSDKLSTVDKQIENAERELLPLLPALQHSEDLARVGPDALRKVLPATAVLVDFLRYTDFERAPDGPRQPGELNETRTLRYLAFLVSGAVVERVELGGAAEIDLAVREFRAVITAKVPAQDEAAGKQAEARLCGQALALRRLLWEPIEKRLPGGTATVYLAPDGALTQLPWAALAGRGEHRVLLEDYALAVLPHGPFLLEQLTRPPPRSPRRATAPHGLLLAAGIHYDARPSAAIVASRGAEGVVEQKVGWAYLKGSDDERQLLAKLLHATVPREMVDLNGPDVTTARLRQELERCRYAHIATHGFFADPGFRSLLQPDPTHLKRTMFQTGIGERVGGAARSPLVLSGLVCSGANLADTPERGILSGDAVAGLLLDDLHLAVLSACDTGIGDVAGGEGVFGLQRAFHIAGCKNVIASLWKVDDAATAALMVRFYTHLFAEDQAKRLPPIEALRRAQLELYRHPELIPAWARGEQRGPGKARPATTPAPAETPRDFVTSEGRAPIRLWAAFTLSGLGR